MRLHTAEVLRAVPRARRAVETRHVTAFTTTYNPARGDVLCKNITVAL